MANRAKKLFNNLSSAARQDKEAIEEGHRLLLELWAGDPWEWLTGEDLNGRQIVWTRDERNPKAPLRPFPRDKAYLQRIVYAALEPEPLFVDKVRQMMVSTGLVQLCGWIARFHPARNILISKQKEGEAEKLIREKLRSSEAMLPDWVKEQLPMKGTPANRVEYPRPYNPSGGLNAPSFIHGVAQNFAASEARGTTATVVLIDEAAYQDATGSIIDAVASMAGHIWVVTTPLQYSKGGRVFFSYTCESNCPQDR